jgi:hypothetical protein
MVSLTTISPSNALWTSFLEWFDQQIRDPSP